MGATRREDHIEVLFDIKQFYDRVGMVVTYMEVEWLDLPVVDIGGTFDEEHVPQLLQFCAENPEFHIVTCTGPWRLANKYVTGKRVYMLASGDQNPYLVLNSALDPNRALVAEEVICAALAILNQGKNVS